ncbi:hypothetical protein [Pragia fontium]|uniref:Uncharacterized membrane protein n=2 Tax=Pragia fontium TaxID=82985 RepID=A0AAJ4WD52_9GAMM|nr:hypothetical protein [Pragia fontium]AKJ40703.1 DNA gyrase subunit B [Pragia fontium]GKX63745.1 hypothetical protein SOASR032_23140 [Pragia fontium]SFD32287.1 Uncharacterized membrane protein [Pragia fontium DSM 5563 = ATCC 49100]
MINRSGRPRFHLAFIIQGLTALAVIGYPFAVYFGLSYWGTSVLAPLLVVLFASRLVLARGKIKQLSWLMKAFALLGILLALASWLLKQNHWLLYYPVVVSLLLLGLFGQSLFRPPSIVERLARLTEPDLPPAGVRYTRRVTQVWCLFFIINGSIALFTCLYDDIKLWTLYNGAISYFLMGILMGTEWIIRKRLRHG